MVQSIIGEISIWEQSGREIFTGSITDNVLIGTKQNTGGEKLFVVGNTKIEGDVEITGTITATVNANTINISDNNTNDTFYLTFVNNSGDNITLNCDKTTTPLTYNPNTGIITAVGFTGDGSNLTNLTISNLNGLIPNSKLLNDSITIGTTEIDLGSSNNILSGLLTVNSTNFNGTLNGTASVATSLSLTATTTNVGYYLVFSGSPSTGNSAISVSNTLIYNPSTNTLTGGVFNGTYFSGNSNSATTSTTASVATSLSLTATTTNVGYYLVFSGSPSTGNSSILVSNTLSYNPSTDNLSASNFTGNLTGNLNGNILTIDATPNNSDFLLTCITPTPSTYNQLLYTDITYNPQTKILKVGKIDNCFALTSSGSNLPILFIDHTITGKQFLYNSNLFYINPTLGEFLLQGNTTTQNINCNNLTLNSTDGGSSAGPDLILYRNSASADDADELGQIIFRGKNTSNSNIDYAKIKTIITDATSNDEGAYIETSVMDGSGVSKIILKQLSNLMNVLSDLYVDADTELNGSVGINTPSGSWNLLVSGDSHFGDAEDNVKYGQVQIVRPTSQGTKFHLSFIRSGQIVCGMGFLNNSNTFGIQNGAGNNTSGAGIFMTNNLVGINQTAPTEALDINGNLKMRNSGGQTVLSMINPLSGGVWNFFTNYATIYNNIHIQNPAGGGGVYMSPGDTFWRAISDDRLKHNEVDIKNGLDVIMKMKPQFYDRSSKMLDANFNGNLDELDIKYYQESGFIAQDVYEIDELKHIVDKGDEEMPWSIQYPQIIAYNTSAIQQLNNKVIKLEEENTYLKNKIIDLENNLELIMEHLNLI
mgnify:CR=1 FL=1